MVKISHLFVVNTPSATVFNNLSTIKGLAGWWTADTSGNPELGGEIRFGFGKDYNIMKVTASKKDRLIAWDCKYSSFALGIEWIGTKLSFALSEDKDKKTLVKFEQNDWKGYTDFYATCNYHWRQFMTSLKMLCETGKGKPNN